MNKQITDHQQRARERLPSFFQEGTNMALFVNAITLETQNLETAFFQLLNERNLSVAVGVQLDGLGQILDLARDTGESDTDYRARLTARVADLARSGDIQTLIDEFIALSGLTGTDTLELTELFPASVMMVWLTDTVDPQDPVADAALFNGVNDLRAAGVRFHIIRNELSQGFEFADEGEGTPPDGPIDVIRGFGDEVLTGGGPLGRIIDGN